jgi:hypothetical protein
MVVEAIEKLPHSENVQEEYDNLYRLLEIFETIYSQGWVKQEYTGLIQASFYMSATHMLEKKDFYWAHILLNHALKIH